MRTLFHLAIGMIAALLLCSTAKADWTDGCPGCGPNYNSAGCYTLSNFSCDNVPGTPTINQGPWGAPSLIISCIATACCDEDGDTNTVGYTEESGWEIQLCLTGGAKFTVVPSFVPGGVEVTVTVQGCIKFGRKTIRNATASCNAPACKTGRKDVTVKSATVTVTMPYTRETVYTVSGCGQPTRTIRIPNCGSGTLSGTDTVKQYDFVSSTGAFCGGPQCACDNACRVPPCTCRP